MLKEEVRADVDAAVRLVSPPDIQPGEVVFIPTEQQFAIDPADLARAQLTVLRERFNDLQARLPPLKAVTEENRITALDALDDVVPLLFPHTVYKSYPVSLLMNARFTELNAWLNDYTTYDLLGLDVSRCETIDQWLDVIEAHTPVRVMVSSGTSGKCSILPKSLIELSHGPSSFAATFSGFRDEPGVDDFCKPSRWLVMPRPRHSRHNMGRVNDSIVACFGGDESHLLTLGGGVSTDMLWMTGQMKKAQADGTFEQLKRSKAWKRINSSLGGQDPRYSTPMSQQELARKVIVELKDKPILFLGGNSFLWTLIETAQTEGLELRFAPTSFFCTAGGAKLDQTNDEQKAQIRERFGYGMAEMYGFGEINKGLRKCAAGHHHPPPWLIPFVLDPDTGAPYPRKGVQTGRFAAFDLWAKTYWGGFITGDEVTLDWDGSCACGRKGAFLHGGITRYTEKNGGDDKITCHRTVAAVAEMMEHMQALRDEKR